MARDVGGNLENLYQEKKKKNGAVVMRVKKR